MRIIRGGFTLVELMIVLAITGIIASALYPQILGYMSRGRDVKRISDIKELSAIFQEYTHINEAYPDNTNSIGRTSYCISDIMLWDDGSSTFRDRQYTKLGGINSLRKDPMPINPHIGDGGNGCLIDGSYYYARVYKETDYAIIAARMENVRTGANWSEAVSLTYSGSIESLMSPKQLESDLNYVDKLYVLTTN